MNNGIIHMNKSIPHHQSQLTRQTVMAWVHSILHDVPATFKVEQLGKGTIYCRIINYYFPGTILVNRIIHHPKTQYQNTINLKVLQNAMAQLKLGIHIDPIRLCREKLSENWTFVSTLYRHLTPAHEEHVVAKEEKAVFGFYPQTIAPSSVLPNPKRSIEQVYSDPFFQGMVRQPLYHLENNQQKNVFNQMGGKYSVGKPFKQNAGMPMSISSPNKGKWSVNSVMFQNNLMPIVDRIKEILLKASHDTEKIRQIKMLLNIPLNEEVVVKVEEDESVQITMIGQGQGNTATGPLESKEQSIPTKADIK